MTSKQVGNTTELYCLAYLNNLGYPISVPYGEGAKYDVIVDVDGQLLRIQTKTCKVYDGYIQFPTRSTGKVGNKCYSNNYTKDDIDYFATYFENTCYLIPVEECGSGSKILRFSPPKKKDNKVNYINEYEAEKKLLDIRVSKC